MARGKNYVNQNKGMTLQASSSGKSSSGHVTRTNRQKKSSVVEMCFYGYGCTRKGCIYRHPTSNGQTVVPVNKSEAPCKPFLVGMCSFNATTCNKRHVTDPAERQRLLDKYKQTPCRHGVHCKQIDNGLCLYSHSETTNSSIAPTFNSFPIYGSADHSTSKMNEQHDFANQSSTIASNLHYGLQAKGYYYGTNRIHESAKQMDASIKPSQNLTQQQINTYQSIPRMHANPMPNFRSAYPPLETGKTSSTVGSTNSESKRGDDMKDSGDSETKNVSFNVNAPVFVPTWR